MVFPPESIVIYMTKKNCRMLQKQEIKKLQESKISETIHKKYASLWGA